MRECFAIAAMLTCLAMGLHSAQAGRAAVLYTDPARDALLVVDGKTGATLIAHNEAVLRHPASLVKMMTLYLIFERLRDGRLKPQSQFTISMNAETQWPAKLHLRAGTTISVQEAIGAIAIFSANDAAVAAAENIAGTEKNFAELMNAKARALGMTHTFYTNASGLPDPLQVTTASDLALLARHLVSDFPEYFRCFGARSFIFRGHEYPSHDGVVKNYAGADGIKTGYTDASGYNLVTTAVRDGQRLIGVVLGGISAERRDREMEHLLDAAFAQIQQKAAAGAVSRR